MVSSQRSRMLMRLAMSSRAGRSAFTAGPRSTVVIDAHRTFSLTGDYNNDSEAWPTGTHLIPRVLFGIRVLPARKSPIPLRSIQYPTVYHRESDIKATALKIVKICLEKPTNALLYKTSIDFIPSHTHSAFEEEFGNKYPIHVLKNICKRVRGMVKVVNTRRESIRGDRMAVKDLS